MKKEDVDGLKELFKKLLEDIENTPEIFYSCRLSVCIENFEKDIDINIKLLEAEGNK